MGGLFSSKDRGKQGSQKKMVSYVEESFQEVEADSELQNSNIRRVPQKMKREKGELRFREISANKKTAIDKSPMVKNLIYNQEWIIEPEIIEHLRIINALMYVEVSPALVLQVTMSKSNQRFICNDRALQDARKEFDEEGRGQKQVQLQYAAIYADLLTIRFQNLVKLKIKGHPKEYSECLVSLEPIAKVYCPLLEQFIADGHPITNARFLRKCNWPFLYKLSLMKNAIVDSQQLGKSLIALANSCHLESLDISGLYSGIWGDISWLIKLGFIDSEEEYKMLEADDNYYNRYNGRTLTRVDCSLVKNRLVGSHTKMIRRKFNTSYFQNPISLW